MKISEIVGPKYVIKFLESLPDGEVFTTQEIADRVGCNEQILQRWPKKASTIDLFAGYWCIPGKVYYWGSKKAISALRKRVAE